VSRRSTNADRARADADAAGDVGRCVADDDDVAAAHWMAEHLLGAPASDVRELGPVVVVRPECADDEPLGRDAHRGELGVRAGPDVAREETEHDVAAGLERVEQLAHAGKDVVALLDVGELRLEQGEVALEHLVDPRVDLAIRDAGVAHQLAHDLRIRLPVEAVIVRAAVSEVLFERTEDRAPAGPVGPEDGAVDVEQNEAAHARGRGERACGRDHAES